MDEAKNGKIERVLRIYTKLLNGSLVNKAEEALNYGVNERSIQRDMDDIRNFLALEQVDKGIGCSIVYDRVQKGYRMERTHRTVLSNGEILAICKVVLGSKAFAKKELSELLNKVIVNGSSKKDQDVLRALVGNEEFHYGELHSKTGLVDQLWEIGQAIRGCHYMDVEYRDSQGNILQSWRIKPVAILFSESYFYLAAFPEQGEDYWKKNTAVGDTSLKIYRIDRIGKLKILEDRFHIPYSNRFEEGIFRKKIDQWIIYEKK